MNASNGNLITYLRAGRLKRARGFVVDERHDGMRKVKPLNPEWKMVWITDEEIRAGAERKTLPQPFRPAPGSFWLVHVESRPNVIAVSPNGDGFFIPGQEPCWPLSHVDKWISEITPKTNTNEKHTEEK